MYVDSLIFLWTALGYFCSMLRHMLRVVRYYVFFRLVVIQKVLLLLFENLLISIARNLLVWRVTCISSRWDCPILFQVIYKKVLLTFFQLHFHSIEIKKKKKDNLSIYQSFLQSFTHFFQHIEIYIYIYIHTHTHTYIHVGWVRKSIHLSWLAKRLGLRLGLLC